MNNPELELRNLEFTYTRSIHSPEAKIKILIIFRFVFTHRRGWYIVLLALPSYDFPSLVGGVEKVVFLTHQATALTTQTLGGTAYLPPPQGEREGTLRYSRGRGGAKGEMKQRRKETN